MLVCIGLFIYSCIFGLLIGKTGLLSLFLQISIPALAVALIKKTKTAILVPNAIVIATSTERVRRG